MISIYRSDRVHPGILDNKINIPPDFKANSANNNQANYSFSDSFTNKMIARKLKIQGDSYANKNQENKAVYYYEKAINYRPDYTAPYYNLAKVYESAGKTDEAISTYARLLQIKPEEVEARTLMGQGYKQKGDLTTAKEIFEKTLHTDPKYDFAARTLKETEYLILKDSNPQQAEELKRQTAEKNLKQAIMLVRQHTPPELTKNLNQLTILFNETDSLSGHKNIAQYEHHNRKIVITSDYIWAAPEVTAAYVVHEAVHARDKDGISSIREEQDAYEESIEFWIANNKGIKDPELDYATDLYKENPQKLRQKVGETYRSRDASMPEYSPYHTPNEGLGLMASLKIATLRLKNQVCNMIGIS